MIKLSKIKLSKIFVILLIIECLSLVLYPIIGPNGFVENNKNEFGNWTNSGLAWFRGVVSDNFLLFSPLFITTILIYLIYVIIRLEFKNKILTTILLTPIIILIVPFILFFLFIGALNFEPITKFNTVYTKSFKIEVWEEEIKSNMSRETVRNLLGKPLRVHEPTRCDFYSESKISWLNFYEYKVCYDGNEMFFLKLKFKYQESPFDGDQWQ